MERAAARPWLRAAAWLAFLAPFFFATYNFANVYASRLSHVPAIAFAWERHVPFLAWTVLVYWSSDLLYGLSLVMCRTREELDRHAWRLIAIQIFSIACFLAFPLRCTYERPLTHGWAAWLFGSLASFDKPFNQAPSLHVSLAVILWARYRRHLSGSLRALAGCWFVLVGLSAWTTYQHQFIDLPAGAWAGLLVLAAIPERCYPESRRARLAGWYLLASIVLTAAAFTWRGAAWLALWPAFSLSMIACGYWTGDPAWLSKRGGRVAFWMWPYTVGAWLNSRWWTRGQDPWQHLADGVWIGRAPGPRGAPFRTVIDLTAEIPVRARYHVPVLDLTVPRADQLSEAIAAIDAAERPVLVCCALGYSRSATVAAAWLAHAGHAASAEEAVSRVRCVRPQVVIGKEELRLVESCTRHAARV